MNGKCDEPSKKKQKKVNRTKCHFKQVWMGKIKQCHEKPSYSYYRPPQRLSCQSYDDVVRVPTATGRCRLRSALANTILTPLRFL